MRINSDRLRTITEVRRNLRSVVEDAESGRTTHVMRDSAVVAHIVPPAGVILQVGDRVAQDIVGAAVEKTIRSAHEGSAAHANSQAALFRVLVWLENDPQLFTRALTICLAAIALHLGPDTELDDETVMKWLGPQTRDMLESDDTAVSALGAALNDYTQVIETAIMAADNPALYSPLTLRHLHESALGFTSV